MSPVLGLIYATKFTKLPWGEWEEFDEYYTESKS